MERRLAAIFAADMVSFSRLMEADELGTLSRQKRHRAELIDPAIARHHGHIVKLTGDGMIAEFASVVDAVQCAVHIQTEMKEREKDAPEDRKIRYRIAVNLGDVIFDEDEGEVYGDGVNIAARLESLAEPGGVVVSGEAYDHLKTKVEVGYRLLGERQLKNIATPVRVYQVVEGQPPAVARRFALPVWLRSRKAAAGFAAGIAVAVLAVGVVAWKPWQPTIARASVERMAHPLPDKPSLVVLPFEDFSDNPEHAYFADGMTEDLITDLSKISGIFVISRNSSWTYKGRAMKPQEVAEELGVQFILEGSVRRGGDQVRINAQLVDALAGHHVWADRYDSKVEDVFALQDKVIREITAALAVQLTAAEEAGIGGVETAHAEAYDAVLHGLDLLRRGSADDILGAIAAFEKAISIDPEYHRACPASAPMGHFRLIA